VCIVLFIFVCECVGVCVFGYMFFHSDKQNNVRKFCIMRSG